MPSIDTPTIALKRQRVKAALANLFVGDSLSMPVHWFYNPGDVLRVFGKYGITGLEAAPETHPSSIMSLHSTSAGGRANRGKQPEQQVVGEYILKGKQHLWGRPQGHYHHGMQAGDNTLNAWWARLLINHLQTADTYQPDDWVQTYIDFMTADPSPHPDTYAESCHRGFFANLIAGKPPLQCGAVTHDTPSMGALVTIAPLALALLGQGETLNNVKTLCREHVWLTHPDNFLMRVVDTYVALLKQLLDRPAGPCDDALFTHAATVISGTRIDKLLAADKPDNYVIGRTYSLACYITDSWPSVCFLAAKYNQDISKALLINTNLGGENAHRGSVLGTLLGMVDGAFPDNWYQNLTIQPALDFEIDQYLNKFYPLEDGATIG